MDDQKEPYFITGDSFEGNLPELIHIFSKRDRMGFEGYKRQLEIIEELKKEGVIEKYFFVSPVSKYGIAELK